MRDVAIPGIPDRKPDVAMTIGHEELKEIGHDAMLDKMREAGFSIAGDDFLLPPARITHYPGVAVVVEQWRKTQ